MLKKSTGISALFALIASSCSTSPPLDHGTAILVVKVDGMQRGDGGRT